MKIDYLRLLHGEPSSFFPTMWDGYDFQALCDFSPSLAEQDREGIIRFGRSLAHDSFCALRGLEPNMQDGMGQSWETAMQQDSFYDLKKIFELGGRQDQVLSVLGLHQAVLQSFMTNSQEEPTPKLPPLKLPPLAPPGSTIQESIDRLMEAYATAAPAIQQMAQAMGGGGQVPSLVPEDVADLNDSDEPGTGDTEVALQIHTGDLESAVEHTGEMQQWTSTVGGFLHGGPPQIFEQALELSEQVNLKDFAKVLGFTKKVVGGAAREIRAGTEEFTGYRPGPLSDKTLPKELLALARHDRQALTRLVDNALPYREFHSERPLGKGPVVVLRDESGSMGGGDLRERHQRALAFEVALAKVFNEESRDLISIRWGSFPVAPFVYGGDGDLSAHLRSFLHHGSTEIVPAIVQGIAATEKYVDGADLLVITDGEFRQGQAEQLPALLAPFRARGGRVWAVLIGTHGVNADWADGAVEVDQLGTDDRMASILEGMTRRDAPQIVRFV